MPIYEYICPQHGKFETIKATRLRLRARCPHCNNKCKLVPSRFSHYWLNPFTVDGEGFTSKYMRKEEVAELDQECREK